MSDVIAPLESSPAKPADEHSCHQPKLASRKTSLRHHDVMLRTPGADTDLLDVIDASGEDRVLVVGGASADILCASVRRGCRSALGVTTVPAHPEAAEVVIAPQVSSRQQADAIAGCACQALRHGTHEGRLVVRILGLGAAGMARGLASHLKALGYIRVQLRQVGRQAVVVVGRFAAAIPAA